MFLDAINTSIPILGVETDDLVNIPTYLRILTKKKPINFKAIPKVWENAIYWTTNSSLVTPELYSVLVKEEKQLIVVTSEKNPLILHCGELPTPKILVTYYLKDIVGEDKVEEVYQALKGLSLKAISEIVLITKARSGSISLKELRHTRIMLGGGVSGLYPVDTDFDFYKFPPKLEEWLKINKKYFLKENIHFKLRPRGVLLEGAPGVGKSLAARAIAKELGVPLFRFDLSTALSKYVGESETRVAKVLSTIERESPCVVLIDEVEKIFTSSEDSGVTTRIMAHLLWWLAEHQSKVLVVMTTNDMSKIPPELYRAGRVNMVMKIPRLSIQEAIIFSQEVLHHTLGKKATMGQVSILSNAIKSTGKDEFSHSEVADIVYSAIKEHDWVV